MKLHKLAYCLLVSVASIIGLLVVLLIGDSLFSNYEYFKHPSQDRLSNIMITTCLHHKLTTSNRLNEQFLNEPTYSEDKIVAWLTAALPNIMTLDHSNIQQQLTDAKKYFTPDGWCHFIDALASANIIDATIERRLEVSIIPQATPKVTGSSVKDGVYTWTVETPVAFKFKCDEVGMIAPADVNNENLVVRISRSSAQTNPDGIGISQWVTIDAQSHPIK